MSRNTRRLITALAAIRTAYATTFSRDVIADRHRNARARLGAAEARQAAMRYAPANGGAV